MQKSRTTDIEYKYFRSTGIDTEKLHQQKEWPLILRMLRVFNDIALAPSISFLLQFAPEEPDLKPIKAAINSHLLRHRASMATEAMKSVIEPLRARESNSDDEIWTIIRDNEDLSRIWNELTSNKYESEKTKAKTVRDKLFAHYDQAPINCAFERLLNMEALDNPERAIHWHIQSTGDGGQISRNVLLDELTNLAWYEVYEIEVSLQGPDAQQTTAAGKTLIEFLTLVHNFVNEIVIAYLEKYKLTTIDSKPPWHRPN